MVATVMVGSVKPLPSEKSAASAFGAGSAIVSAATCAAVSAAASARFIVYFFFIRISFSPRRGAAYCV